MYAAMRRAIIFGLILLAGCKPSEAGVLEKTYAEQQKFGRESCAEEQKIASAYAREGNQAKHKEWKLSADIQCMYEQTAGR